MGGEKKGGDKKVAVIHVRREDRARAFKRCIKHDANICFDCTHACGGENGCSWSRDFVPVEGSKYEVVPYNHVGEKQKAICMSRGYSDMTYKITECPLFERDAPRANYWGKAK